jgi:hypothetical protein
MPQTDLEKRFDGTPATYSEADLRLFQTFKDALNSGTVRAAEPDPSARRGWRVNRGESIPVFVQGAARL